MERGDTFNATELNVRVDGDVSKLYGNDHTRWDNEWTKVVVNGSTLEAALTAFMHAVRDESGPGCHQPVYADTCLGPSCNPTCLDEVRLSLVPGPGADAVPAWLVSKGEALSKGCVGG